MTADETCFDQGNSSWSMRIEQHTHNLLAFCADAPFPIGTIFKVYESLIQVLIIVNH